ncbi:Predicted naringenin-chalcone synthase [Ekhidna lutea]|uniref:Predicted naringenin-chalcone synthase n=1 Tax=Ekhidna lutea TaxID=447679 RepID=A0A239IPT7_EKHLU|nr:type III polyketide synthase [Ekhidna lutea]SNS95228.1 Predicted naringenin-chalcone synthase [Ekhidna lutea]
MNYSQMTAYIQSIGTALPPNLATQNQIADFMVSHLKLNKVEEKKLRVLYRASGIKQRYSVLKDFSENLNGQSFFKEDAFPSAKPRMLIYQEHAINLAFNACNQALKDSTCNKEDITHLIAVSCTGMYAPGLDIELIGRLGLKTTTQRTSINFMGCYAAFNAMKVSQNILGSDPKANVLIVCVELCSIHLQEKKDDENLLANAIFGDGAAAMVVSSAPAKRSLKMESFYSDLALQGRDEMGWYIGDHGFEMHLSARVPDVIKDGIAELTDHLLEKIQLEIGDIDYFAIHPGGKRILDVIEEKLLISKDQNQAARHVLNTHGNMSSPTVLFVIKSILDELKVADHNKHLLSFAFGPGLTMESAVLKTHINA